MKNVLIAIIATAAIAISPNVHVTIDQSNIPVSGTAVVSDGLGDYSWQEIVQVPAIGATTGVVDYENLSPVNWNSDQNGVPFPTGFAGLEISLTGNQELRGIQAATTGVTLLLFNKDNNNNLLIPSDDNAAATGDRFFCPNNSNYALRENASVWIRYDESLDLGNGGWHMLGDR